MIKVSQDLAPGDRYNYRYHDVPVVVTILRAPELSADRFGRPMIKVWASRSDTGAEGWLIFGPDTPVHTLA